MMMRSATAAFCSIVVAEDLRNALLVRVLDSILSAADANLDARVIWLRSF